MREMDEGWGMKVEVSMGPQPEISERSIGRIIPIRIGPPGQGPSDAHRSRHPRPKAAKGLAGPRAAERYPKGGAVALPFAAESSPGDEGHHRKYGMSDRVIAREDPHPQDPDPEEADEDGEPSATSGAE